MRSIGPAHLKFLFIITSVDISLRIHIMKLLTVHFFQIPITYCLLD
jgi:hypothetical protein